MAVSAGAASASLAPQVTEPGLNVPVLMYHRIVPMREAGPHAAATVISPEAFSEQLSALAAAGWHTITLGRLSEYLRAGETPPDRTFVITIDDGWADGYRYAFPRMREHGFVGTFFVVTGRVGHRGYMTAAQLRALDAAGQEIGNHTVRHVSLKKISARDAKDEVAVASRDIERIVGHRPTSFAYPLGDTNETAFDAVAGCPGLRIAVTTRPGIVTSRAERFHEPRLNVGPETATTALLAEMSAGR